MKLSFTNLWTLIILSQPILCSVQYDKSDNSAHGIRFAGNDRFVIFSINSFKLFGLRFYPFGPSDECMITYPMKNLYVYSLTTMPNNDNTTVHKFLQVAEDVNTQNVILTIFTINQSNCGMLQKISYNLTDFITSSFFLKGYKFFATLLSGMMNIKNTCYSKLIHRSNLHMYLPIRLFFRLILLILRYFK